MEDRLITNLITNLRQSVQIKEPSWQHINKPSSLTAGKARLRT